MSDLLQSEANGLRRLLSRLACYKVSHWGTSSSEPSTVDREPAPLDQADVASSLRPDGRHALVIDIDHNAWLVRSSTPGHYHLYVDVKDGIKSEDYFNLLAALAEAGVIEPGYAGASMARGRTYVRLPWIKKETGG